MKGFIMKDRSGNIAPFGIKDKVGYLFGDFGNDFTFILSASFLLKFYTTLWVYRHSLSVLLCVASLFFPSHQHTVLFTYF